LKKKLLNFNNYICLNSTSETFTYNKKMNVFIQ